MTNLPMAPVPSIRVAALDHLVLTVHDLDATVAFYSGVLGMTEVVFGAGRRALAFGTQKINLHPADAPFVPHAEHPGPGSADLCFLVDTPLGSVVAALDAHGVTVEAGPVERTGATGPIRSVYVRDPDGNLVELSNRLAD